MSRTGLDDRERTLSSNDDSVARDHVAEHAHAIERRYQLLDEIARGGAGKIIRARDRALDRYVAIKQPLDPDRGAARVRAEGAVLSSLQHPSIIAILDIGLTADGVPFYAMPLVAGRPLRDVIADAQSLEQRLALLPHVIAIADAIAHAHGRGIIHRDLKPSNVLVGEHGETVVIDWGLATTAGGAVAPSRAVVGTAAYMPPEQARGETVDTRSDVYAVGAILYHLLAGRPPFAERDRERTLEAAANEAPAAIEQEQPRAPRDLVAIVQKAMTREPDDRYPTARELAEDLVRFQTGRLVAARRYSPLARARRWLVRHQAVAIAALASTAAITVTAVALSRRAPPVTSVCGLSGAQLNDVWNGTRRAVIAARIPPNARDAWQRTAALLDAYTQRWITSHTSACEATEVRREQPIELQYARWTCLARGRDELAALIAMVETSPELAVRGPEMVLALTSSSECDNVDTLRVLEPLPTDPATRAEIASVRRQTAEAKAAFDAGQYADATTRAAAAVERARETRYRPALAEALLEVGMAAITRDDSQEAEVALLEAIDHAEASRHDQIAARAWIVLPMVIATSHAGFDRIKAWERRGRAALARLHDPPRLVGVYENILGLVAHRGGNRASAAAHWRRSVELFRATKDPDLFHYSLALHNLGLNEAMGTHPSRALPYLEESIKLVSEQLGPDHPNLTLPLCGVARIADFAGDHQRASALCERALDHVNRFGAPERYNALETMIDCADVARAAGRSEEALAALVRLNAEEAPPRYVVERELATARSLRDLRRFSDARAATVRALEIARGEQSDHGRRLRIAALVELSASELALGRIDRARATAKEALDAVAQHAPTLQLYHAALVAVAAAGGNDASKAISKARQLEREAEISDEARVRSDDLACRFALPDAPTTCRPPRVTSPAVPQPAR